MSFAKDVSKFVLNVGDANERIIRATVIQLWSGIIEASPVDTGRFRANWFPSDITPSDKVSTNEDHAGVFAKARATQSVKTQQKFNAFTLTNNLPYADVIEFGGYGDGPETANGFSKQAPQGVVRVTVMRFNSLIIKNAAKFRV